MAGPATQEAVQPREAGGVLSGRGRLSRDPGKRDGGRDTGGSKRGP